MSQPSLTPDGDLHWGIGPRAESQGVPRAEGIRSLNRQLDALIRDTWDDLDRALRITETHPDFSGILPLGDPGLQSFLAKPGVFVILGPQPALPILHIGASRGPIGFVLRSRIEEAPGGGFGWKGEKQSEPRPTFAAIATMEQYWAFAPPLRNLLAKRLGSELDLDESKTPTPFV